MNSSPSTALIRDRLNPSPLALTLLGSCLFWLLVVVGFGTAGDLNAAPPTLTEIGDILMMEDTPSDPLPFTVSDLETPASQLVVTATSANPALLPQSGLILGGAGAERTLVMVPATNAFGLTQVTLTVTDGDRQTMSTTFQVKIFNTEDPPSLSIPTKKFTVDSGTQIRVDLLIGDPDGLEGLRLAGLSNNNGLVPDQNLFFGGSGANRFVLVQPVAGQAGTVHVTVNVIDPQGEFATDGFDVEFRAPALEPPVILAQPDSLAAPVGAAVTFSVAAKGSEPIRYQWQFNGFPLAFATNAQLTLSGLTAEMAGGYRVVLSNPMGFVTSDTATLSVIQPPSILTQPKSAEVIVGSPAHFEVEASGQAPFGYQWQWNGTNLTGATTPFYDIATTTFTNAGSYTVVVNNQGGAITSQVAVLTVKERPNFPPIVSLASPAQGTRFFAPKDLRLSALASDLDGSVVRVDFYSGTNRLGSATGSPFEFVVTNLAAGTYVLSAVATDNRGGTASSGAITVTGVSGTDTTPGHSDPGFNPFVGPNAAVMALSLTSDGSVLVAGSFTRFNDVARGGLARISAGGLLDASFGGVGADSTVNALAVQSDGRILLGGTFSRFNGLPRPGIARLNADGTMDGGFDPGVGTSSGSQVYAIVPLADGRILVGGSFSDFNGQRRSNLVRLNPDGGVDSSFLVTAGVSGGSLTRVSSIVVRPDGSILVGGEFTEAAGVARARLALFKSTGQLDTTFNPPAPDGTVNALALMADGSVVVGGGFTGVTASTGRVAATGLFRLKADGTLDPAFATGTGIDQAVNALVLHPDGRVLVGGAFTTVAGVPRHGLARVLANGTLDSSFDVGVGVAGGFVPRVSALARAASGRVYVGGDFSTFDGLVLPYLAAVNTESDVVVQPKSARFTQMTVDASGVVTVGVQGGVGNTYVLQASSDFGAWVGVVTNKPTADSFTLRDPGAVGRSRRFYRIVIP